jgi:nucleoside-diphosphate-sugar epimerase
MNIFLTGASGFIGGTVALRLKASGHRIRGLVRSSEKAARL